MKLGELAARLGCTLEGDAHIEILKFAGIESPRREITFLQTPDMRGSWRPRALRRCCWKIKLPLTASPASRRFPHCAR